MGADCLTVTGLLLDCIGVVTVFVFAPEKNPDPQSLAFFAVEDDSRARWMKAQKRRTIMVRIGVGVIVMGFLLQGAAVVLW